MAVEPLRVAGVVIDVVTGDPLPAAQVFLEGTDRGVLSDRDGRFTLDAPESGRFRLTSVLIGYRRVSALIDVAASSGVLAQIGMRDAPIRCHVDCFGQPCPSGVLVRVADVLTGLAPDAPVVLRVAFSGSVDSAYAEPRRGLERMELSAGGGFDADGPFQVEVEAAGYAPWRASDVWVEPTPCIPRSTPILDVLLLKR